MRVSMEQNRPRSDQKEIKIKFRHWKLTEREVSTQKQKYSFIQVPLCAHSLLSISMSQRMRIRVQRRREEDYKG